MATITAVYSEISRYVSRYWGYDRDPPTSGDAATDIADAIRTGLRKFYHCGHPWRFLYPTAVLETSAPYSTGTITVAADASGSIVTLTGGTWPTAVGDNWRLRFGGDAYDVASRTSDTVIVLDDDDVVQATATSYEIGQPYYDLPDDFAGFFGKGLFTYQPGTGDFYGPIPVTDESLLRIQEEDFDWSHPPMQAALIPKAFDATVGQRWQVQFWPVPNAEYRLYYRYVHDPEMLDSTNVHHWGGTPYSEAIRLACLAAAEEMLNDGSAQMEQRFQAALQIAIEHDKRANAPDRLGPFYDPSDGARSTYPSREEFLVDYRQPHPTIEGS